MYNVLEKLRSGEALTAKEKVIHEHGLVSVLKQLHDELDAAVFDAYGWSSELTDEALLEKLVALNAERADEEKRGLIRWLRPEFQNPSGKSASTQSTLDVEADADAGESDSAAPVVQSAPAWPKKLSDRLAGVRSVISVRGRDWSTTEVARSFKNAKTADVDAVLESLAALGLVVAIGDEDARRWRAAQ